MKTQNLLKYLSDLELNNERDWYHANKSQRLEACGDFEEIVQRLISKIGENDSSILYKTPKELIFRLPRDTRFNRGKAPFNPSFRANIAPCGKLFIPVGYYLSIMPHDRSFLAGGMYGDSLRDATTMIRDYIVEHGDEWEQIINAESFTKFFTLKGTALKNVPRGYDREHPQAEYLKYKSWYVDYAIGDKQLHSVDRFVSLAAEVFHAMQPFNAFLNRALINFEMPTRM